VGGQTGKSKRKVPVTAPRGFFRKKKKEIERRSEEWACSWRRGFLMLKGEQSIFKRGENLEGEGRADRGTLGEKGNILGLLEKKKRKPL